MGYGLQLDDDIRPKAIQDTIIKTDDPIPKTPDNIDKAASGAPMEVPTNGTGAGTDEEKKNTKEAAWKAGAGVLGDALSATALLLGGDKGSRYGGDMPSAAQGDVPYSASDLEGLDRMSLSPDQRASLALSILSTAGGIR